MKISILIPWCAIYLPGMLHTAVIDSVVCCTPHITKIRRKLLVKPWQLGYLTDLGFSQGTQGFCIIYTLSCEMGSKCFVVGDGNFRDRYSAEKKKFRPFPSLSFDLVHMQSIWLFCTDEQLFTQTAFYLVTGLHTDEENSCYPNVFLLGNLLTGTCNILF